MKRGGSIALAAATVLLAAECACEHTIKLSGHGDGSTDPSVDTSFDEGPDTLGDPDVIDVETSDPSEDLPSSDCPSGDVTIDMSNWMVRIDSGYNESPGNVAVGYDGRIIISGSQGPEYGDDPFWLLELDGTGGTIAQSTFEGITVHPNGTAVLPLSDCGLLLGGATSLLGAADTDIWLMKLDYGRAILWDRVLGGPGDESNPAIIETADGGYLLAANTQSPSTPARWGLWLAKLDGDAAITWQEGLGLDGDEFFLGQGGLVEAPDGIVYVVFTTDFHPGSSGCVIASLDPEGGMLWQKAVSLEGITEWTCLLQDVLVVGDDLLVAGGIITAVPGHEVAWVAKLTRAGTLVWQKAFHSGDYAHIEQVMSGSDGTYIASGMMVVTIGGERQNKVWIGCITPDGDIAWQRFIGEWEVTTGRDIDDWQGKAIPHFDGIVAVCEDETHNDGPTYDVAIARLAADGTFPGECSYVRTAEATSYDTSMVLVDSDVPIMAAYGVVAEAHTIIHGVDFPPTTICP